MIEATFHDRWLLDPVLKRWIAVVRGERDRGQSGDEMYCVVMASWHLEMNADRSTQSGKCE